MSSATPAIAVSFRRRPLPNTIPRRRYRAPGAGRSRRRRWFRLAGGTQERPPFAFPGFWRQWDWKSGGLRRKSDAELARTNARLLAMVFPDLRGQQRGSSGSPVGHARRPPYAGGLGDLACRQRRRGCRTSAPLAGQPSRNRIHRRERGQRRSVTAYDRVFPTLPDRTASRASFKSPADAGAAPQWPCMILVSRVENVSTDYADIGT